MKITNRLLATTAVAAFGFALSTTASAATFADPWTVSSNGISVVFGDNGMDVAGAENVAGETTTTHLFNSATGAFTDTFSFQLPNGFVGFTLSSIGFAANSSVTLTSLLFNGSPISFTNTPNDLGGNGVSAMSGPFTVMAGGPQTLTVMGTAGADAVYDGTATFIKAAAVPEASTWALMIVGFGGAGAMLRRRSALKTA